LLLFVRLCASLQLNLFLAVLKSRFASAQALFHEARKKQRAQRRLHKRMMAMAAAGRLRPDDPRLVEQVIPPPSSRGCSMWCRRPV
jgi:hypothetical protein